MFRFSRQDGRNRKEKESPAEIILRRVTEENYNINVTFEKNYVIEIIAYVMRLRK